jgi:hypothetical protein
VYAHLSIKVGQANWIYARCLLTQDESVIAESTGSVYADMNVYQSSLVTRALLLRVHGVLLRMNSRLSGGYRLCVVSMVFSCFPILNRNHLLRSTPAAKTLHTILASEAFTTHFGPPHPHPQGDRQSVFGHEDELKVAPKGVDKNHKYVVEYRSNHGG